MESAASKGMSSGATLEAGRALAARTLQGIDGEIGRVEEFYFDDRRWPVRYLVVNTGGWLMGRRVLIPPAGVAELSADGRRLRVELTREQIRNSPHVDTRKPVSRLYKERYYSYYGWPPYWDTGLVPGLPPTRTVPAVASAAGSHATPDPKQTHLRSSSEVSGYRIAAQDDAFGHVEDFLIDTRAWSIRYLEIDTRNWWPGRHVLISPDWIEAVDWVERSVVVGLKRDLIERAPEYESAAMVDRAYEARLHRHYGRHGYWHTDEEVG
jgi:hypothetical protein